MEIPALLRHSGQTQFQDYHNVGDKDDFWCNISEHWFTSLLSRWQRSEPDAHCSEPRKSDGWLRGSSWAERMHLPWRLKCYDTRGQDLWWVFRCFGFRVLQIWKPVFPFGTTTCPWTRTWVWVDAWWGSGFDYWRKVNLFWCSKYYQFFSKHF